MKGAAFVSRVDRKKLKGEERGGTTAEQRDVWIGEITQQSTRSL